MGTLLLRHFCLRREDDGHGIVQDALPEQQRVQVHVHLELVEYGQHRHYGSEKGTKWMWMCKRATSEAERNRKPGSVAETMEPKKRQSVKKKSPLSCPTTFMKDTNPYIINLGRGDCDQRWVGEMKQGKGGGGWVNGEWGSRQQEHSPNNEAGNDCSQEGIG